MTDAQKKVFATEMKRLREEANMSTSEFSRYLGVSQSYISNIECVNRTPSMPLMEKIAGAFDLTVDDMLKPHEEKVAEERVEYGKKLAKARADKGYSVSLVAGALGIPPAVYREYEQGACSITERNIDTLNKLLGIGEAEEAPAPIEVEVKAEAEVEDPISVVICDIVLEHITDLKVDKDTQRKVWRYFSNLKLTAEERRLFG